MCKKLLFLFIIFVFSISCRKATTSPTLDSTGNSSDTITEITPEPKPDSKFIIIATDTEEVIESKIQKYYEENNEYLAFVEGSEEDIKQNNTLEKINTVITRNAYSEGISLDLSETTIIEIPDSSFKGNKYLSYVTLPETLTSIGNNAFEDADKLISINFPSMLTKIGLSAFANCINLQEANLKDTKITILYEQSFFNCSSLNELIFPNGLLTIKNSAFAFCISLEEITFPERLQIIEQFVFGGCDKLKNVNFNDEIQSIYHIAFYECTSLSSISLPSSLQELGAVGLAEIFQNCTSLSDVEYLGTDPDAITCFGNIFGTTTNPENLYLPNVDEPLDITIKDKWNKFLGYNWENKIKYKTSMPNN